MTNWTRRERRLGDKVAGGLWLTIAVVLLVLGIWALRGCP